MRLFQLMLLACALASLASCQSNHFHNLNSSNGHSFVNSHLPILNFLAACFDHGIFRQNYNIFSPTDLAARSNMSSITDEDTSFYKARYVIDGD